MVIEPNPASLPQGRIFAARYEVVRPVSAGGMGAVYEVIDRRNLRRRALKVMLPGLLLDTRLRERFEREATVTAAIESEHIVEVLDAGVDDETKMPYLAMELLRGEDLGRRLQREGKLLPAEVVKLLGQAALALERTHAAGVVHRDLKPDNLYLTTRDDGTPRLKILDFGIAKLVAPTGAGKTTGSIGTPLYMAPEQLKGDKDLGPACDLYSLGHIAYTLLVGVEYWSDDLGEDGGVYPLLVKLIEGVTEPPTERAARHGVVLPVGFDAWFCKATDTEPDARPAGAHELVCGLATALGVDAPAQPSAGSGPVAVLSVDPTAKTIDATPLYANARREGPMSALTPSVRTEISPPSVLRLPMTRPIVPILALGALLTAGAVGLLVWRARDSARAELPPPRAAALSDSVPLVDPSRDRSRESIDPGRARGRDSIPAPPIVEPSEAQAPPVTGASSSPSAPRAAEPGAPPPPQAHAEPHLHAAPAAAAPRPAAPTATAHPGPGAVRKQAGPDDPGF